MDYFFAWGQFSEGYKQHNAALKFLREQQENADDPSNSPTLHLDADGWTAVAVINHDAKGMGWKWKDESRWWSWHKMTAQMTEESRATVVKGPKAAVAASWGCSFAVRPNSYDHSRSYMLNKTSGAPSVKVPIWDFVVHRADGTAISLHLEWKKPRFPSFAEEGHG